MPDKKPGLTADEHQALVDELRQISDQLGSVTAKIAVAYGKIEPITEEAIKTTREVHKLIHSLEEID